MGKDVYDGAVCLKSYRSRKMEAVLDFLGECWKSLGLPAQVQYIVPSLCCFVRELESTSSCTSCYPAIRSFYRSIYCFIDPRNLIQGCGFNYAYSKYRACIALLCNS